MAATGFLKQNFNFRVQLFTFTQHWSDFWSGFRTNDWTLKIYCNRKQSVAWAHSNVLPFVGWGPWWPAWHFPGWLQELHYCWGTEAAAGMSKNTNIWLHNYIPILKGIWSYSDWMHHFQALTWLQGICRVLKSNLRLFASDRLFSAPMLGMALRFTNPIQSQKGFSHCA